MTGQHRSRVSSPPRSASPLGGHRRRNAALAAAALSATVLTTASTATAAGAAPATYGAAGYNAPTTAVHVPAGCRTGLGDRIHPDLGTPGVRIRRYTTAMIFAAGLRSYTATTAVDAAVAQRWPLGCIALDFSRGAVLSVDLDGRPVPSRSVGQKLYVLPAHPLAAGSNFTVRVRTATPVRDPGAIGPNELPGIFGDGHWVQMLVQPSAAHEALPMADHPAQKAPWTFDLTVPRGVAAVANGQAVAHRTGRSQQRYVYRTAAPMATHVMQITVGPLRKVTRGTASGVRVRHWIPRGASKATLRALDLTRRHLAWLTARLGPYPFAEYGVLATPFGGEMETQTLATLSVDELQDPVSVDAVMLHELAHQWFGDSVSVRRWGSDLWLAEGHATFYENSYPAPGEPPATDRIAEAAYRQLQGWIDQYGPVARPKHDSTAPGAAAEPYNVVAYQGGALVLYALRAKVGAATFQRIERAWLTTFRGRSAGTDDFIALAGRVSGRDLTAFLRAWLYGTTVPPMPGHPNWTP